MSNQEKYYAHKVAEIEAVKRKQDLDEIIRLSLIAAAVAACVLGAIFVISPGLLVTMLAIKFLSLRLSTPMLWCLSVTVSFILVCLIFWVVKNFKIMLGVYALICASSVLVSFLVRDDNSENLVDGVYYKYLWVITEGSDHANAAKSTVSNASGASSASSVQVAVQVASAVEYARLVESDKTSKPEIEEKNVVASEELIRTNSVEPSFSCKGHLLKVEEIICGDQDLSELDLKLSDVYKAKIQQADDKKQVKSDQIDWIVNSMRKCTERNCLLSAYQSRIKSLEAQ